MIGLTRETSLNFACLWQPLLITFENSLDQDQAWLWSGLKPFGTDGIIEKKIKK